MSQLFTDRTVLITGAAGGIGGALAHELVAEGATLILHDLRETALTEFAASLPSEAITLVSGDIADESTIAALVAAAQRFGGLDGFAPAAGIYAYRELEEMTNAEWRQTLTINLDSVFALTTALLPHFNTGASIVNFTSIAGERGSFGHAHYAASKGALVAFTRSLALELGSRNIRANCVAPGIIATTMTDSLVAQSNGNLERTTPLGRLGHPKEVASAVAFLLSDKASFITGVQLDVNGGLYMAG